MATKKKSLKKKEKKFTTMMYCPDCREVLPRTMTHYVRRAEAVNLWDGSNYVETDSWDQSDDWDIVGEDFCPCCSSKVQEMAIEEKYAENFQALLEYLELGNEGGGIPPSDLTDKNLFSALL